MYQQRDNFLSSRSHGALVRHAATAEFGDRKNPVDGVTYPLICDDVPDLVRREIELLVEGRLNYIFLRKMPAGIVAPAAVHTDNSMGRQSLMLYLDDPPEGVTAGTAFMRHRVLGICYAPAVDELVRLCRESANDHNAWVAHALCRMAKNRACYFDAGYFHLALPVTGFGEEASARTVLTAFFD